MLRSSRTVALLVRSLVLGTATIMTGAAATTVAGCRDESQPEYWVDKLSDSSWRPRAIKRLEQFFEDTYTKANKDLSTPDVQTLLNKIADPLTKTYVDNYADLDVKTRVALIKLLAAFKDKRTEPALKKAFDEYVKKPSGSKEDSDIKWAADACADLKLDSCGDGLLNAFQKLKAHTMLGGITYRDFNNAMVRMPQKAWSGPLKTMLEQDMIPPTSAKDKDKIDPYRDQQFWQQTSAQVLGVLKDDTAIEPIMKVLLDPNKVDISVDALLALVKIGKPAVDRAVKLLKGEDEKLVGFAAKRVQDVQKLKEPPKDKPHIPIAAAIIGTAGRGEATPTMIAALKSADADSQRAMIARNLPMLPPTPESKAAFKEAFEKISIESNVQETNALQMLTESAGQYYDPSLVEWLLDRAANTKGSGEDLKALQAAILVTTLKLAKADQLDKVKAAVDKYGTKLEKDLYAQVEKVTKTCANDAACWLKEVEKGENQDQKNQFVGIKAGYMLAILGNEATRDEIIARMDAIDNAAVRYTAAAAIDYLSPKGSKDAAAKLARIIDKNKESGDQNKIMGDAPLKQVMYRLETRAS